MGELSPNAVYVASAKPESPAPVKESKIVRKAKEALNKWWERVGHQGIENRFVQAHQNILNTFDDENRAKAYEQTGIRWQKWGKTLGVTAAILDAGLAGLGFGMASDWFENPNIGRKAVNMLGDKIHTNSWDKPERPTWPQKIYLELSRNIFSHGVVPNELLPNSPDEPPHPKIIAERKYASHIGTAVALIPGFAGLLPVIGTGPAHTIAHMIGMGAEQVGKMKARTHNYVDSGKASEHAKAVGKTLGEAATKTAQWAAEHPDEIRKTVDTVSRVKRQNDESKQKITQARQKAADAALEAEYQDWIAHHPDKTYHEQSGFPYPSKAEYVQMKKEEELKRKKNLEAEKRGMA